MSDGHDMRMGEIAGFGVAFLVGLVGSAAALAESSVAGSPHDLSGRTAAAASEICGFCHVPEKTGLPDRPLWTRLDLPPGAFTAYDDPTSEDPLAFQPLGTSLVCLSCHDGTIAWDTLATPGISVSALRRGGGISIGAGGLANNHPISVSYYDGYDAAFNRPIGGKVGELPLFRASGARGAGDRVECASCHNPHEIMFGKFLRVSNGGSALCRRCHDK